MLYRHGFASRPGFAGPAKPPPYYIRALLNAEVTAIVGKIKISAIIKFSVLKIAKNTLGDVLGLALARLIPRPKGCTL